MRSNRGSARAHALLLYAVTLLADQAEGRTLQAPATDGRSTPFAISRVPISAVVPISAALRHAPVAVRLLPQVTSNPVCVICLPFH